MWKALALVLVAPHTVLVSGRNVTTFDIFTECDSEQALPCGCGNCTMLCVKLQTQVEQCSYTCGVDADCKVRPRQPCVTERRTGVGQTASRSLRCLNKIRFLFVRCGRRRRVRSCCA